MNYYSIKNIFYNKWKYVYFWGARSRMNLILCYSEGINERNDDDANNEISENNYSYNDNNNIS